MASDDRPEEQLILLDIPPTEVAMNPEVRQLDRPIWTENKARLIERYLFFFVMVTKHGTYIDGFAGPQSGEPDDMWSARLVLQTQPPWLRHFHLYDRDRQQAQRLTALSQLDSVRATNAHERGRDVRVYHGDFNEEVQKLLISGEIRENEATFCLLDQRTFECHWATVEALAAHKRTHKIEIFYFLPQGWLDRAFAGQRDLSVLERWWGRSDWARLRGMRSHDRAQLMADRFMQELGYRSAKAWPIYKREGGEGPVMYHMIHATDHPEAPKLMRRAYAAAVTAPPGEQFALDFALEPSPTTTGQTTLRLLA
jgi:three-Cys-motif partner protein